MPFENYEDSVQRAARLCGIEHEFWDIFGHHHAASLDTNKAILTSLGLACESAEQLEQALRERTCREWRRMLPPALVAGVNDTAFGITLYCPRDAVAARAELQLEDGGVRHFDFDLAALAVDEAQSIDGVDLVRRGITLQGPLPLGYHVLRVTAGERQAAMRLIIAPDRAYQPAALQQGGKTAGLCISLYGLRSSRNWGCGDSTDLRGMIDWAAAELGVDYLALNPLHAIHNRRPYNTSPYLPNSIFFRNLLYIDVEAVEDFQNSRRAQAAWKNDAVQQEAADLRAAPHVEYERVAALKLRFLKLAFCQFLREYRRRTPRAEAFRRYLAEEGDLLLRFATYCALDESIHSRQPDVWLWTDWPEEYRDPASEAIRRFQQRAWRRVLFYGYAQWLLDQQLQAAQQHARDAGMQIGLYHDLALATDRFGSDLWAHREFFATGCRVGSPPDDFSPAGQDWGFPPPNTERHREDGYRLFAETIRRTARHGGALRIDHVMRFFRLYWIPDATDAANGAYVRDRADDLIRILALESVRQQVLVVGEDLGTVEPYIRETLERFGIYSYRVFFFEHTHDGAFRLPQDYPAQALVCTATHDLPTVAGFWTGRDIEARREAGLVDEGSYQQQWASRTAEKQKMLDVLHRAGLLPAGYPTDAASLDELTPELHHAVIGFLAVTPAALLVVNQEDLTRELHQQNLPGSTWQYPNWGRKMRFTLEELTVNAEAVGCTSMLRHWLTRSGRTAS